MKNFKEKLKKLKNPFLVVFTIFMFLLSLLTAYHCGFDKGKESVNNTQFIYNINNKKFSSRAGNVVPNTGYVEKVFFNFDLDINEVEYILSSLTYTNSEFVGLPVYGMLATHDYINDEWVDTTFVAFNFLDMFGGYAIVEFDSGTLIFSSNSIISNEFGESFLGWNTFISSEFVVNGTAENMIQDIPFGNENNLLVNLFSVSTFLNTGTYEDGYEAGLQAGYLQGYQQGVYNSTNPLVGFDNTKLSTFYYTDTDVYLNDTDIDFGINGYTYDLTSEVQTLKDDRLENSNGSDSGIAYIVIYDFQPYISKLLDFTSIGFDKIIVNYNNSTSDFVNISDYRQYTESTFNTDKIVISIELYFNALIDLPKYELNLIYNNTYQNGYQSGYSDGLSQGTQNGFREGYTEGKEEGRTEGYEIGKTEGYNQGYNVGNSEACKLNTLVFSIADIPVYILSKLLGFELFGFNLFVAFCSVVTIILIIFLVKKFSK